VNPLGPEDTVDEEAAAEVTEVEEEEEEAAEEAEVGRCPNPLVAPEEMEAAGEPGPGAAGEEGPALGAAPEGMAAAPEAGPQRSGGGLREGRWPLGPTHRADGPRGWNSSPRVCPRMRGWREKKRRRTTRDPPAPPAPAALRLSRASQCPPPRGRVAPRWAPPSWEGRGCGGGGGFG